MIFLDFDGPLFPTRSFYHPRNQTVFPRQFDPFAVGMIQWCATKADAQYVISSSWRDSGRELIGQIFEENGFETNRIHEDWCTPRFGAGSLGERTEEILLWLNAHPEVTMWAAIDDFGDQKRLPGLIKVTFDDGFLYRHFLKLKKLFNITANIGDQLLLP